LTSRDRVVKYLDIKILSTIDSRVQSTAVQQLGEWVAATQWSDLSEQARDALELRVLDALGCAIGALGSDVMARVRAEIDEMGGQPMATLIGGGRTSADRAALHNSAAVRYLDFNDSFLAPGETCHPSDNLGAVLAAVEFAGGGGRDLMVALAVAYQVQCRLSEVAPVRARGFDHVTQMAYGAAAGAARGLRLDASQTANAIAIAGTAFNALRVTRTGRLSNWKGLAAPNTAFAAVHAAFLARAGITGPDEVFEGNKGFEDSIAGPFTIDWSREDLEIVRRTSVKRFNAEFHSQSALEAALELREAGLDPRRIRRVDLDVFQVAFDIIGGGEEGDKKLVRTKEEADHSLPYMTAVALLDGKVMPQQYEVERIGRADVQDLLQRVHVRPDPVLTARFPREHACRLRVTLDDGAVLHREKSDFLGFVSRTVGWPEAECKFRDLGGPASLVELVRNLDSIQVSELCRALGDVRR
jgi:2-methylcitrate dehydratase